jgi:hypothetical protein
MKRDRSNMLPKKLKKSFELRLSGEDFLALS